MRKMKLLLVVFIICSSVAEIFTELPENANTISSSTTNSPESLNTTSLVTEAVTRTSTNESILRQGEIVDLSNKPNNSDHVLVDSKDNEETKSKDYVSNNIGRNNEDMELMVKLEAPELNDTNRQSIKNLFKRILAYKDINIEGINKGKDNKNKFVKAYVLWIIQKYGRRQNGDKEVFLNQRHKRSVKESAGYTHDSETCKVYNNNLIDMWSNLSKYFNTAEKSLPNKSVLHNIGIMIKAYLDHVNPVEISPEAPADTLVIRKDRNISNILSPIIVEIEAMINKDNKVKDVTVLTFFILEQVKHFREVSISEECINKIQHEITTLINLAFQKYLLNANCNIATDDNKYRVLKNKPLNYSEANKDIFTITYPNSYINTQIQNKVKSDPDNDQAQINLLNSGTRIIKRSDEEVDLLPLKNMKSMNGIINNPSMILDYNRNIPHFKNLDEIFNQSKMDSDLLDSSSEKSNNLRTTMTFKSQLTEKNCNNVAIDQLMLTLKYILRLYLFNDDCQSKGSIKFFLITELIKGTPVFKPFRAINIDDLNKYNAYVQFLENIQIADLNNNNSVLKSSQNNKARTEISNDDISKSYVLNYQNDQIRNQQSNLNSLQHYQQLYLPSYVNLINPKLVAVTSKPEYKLLLGNSNKNEESVVKKTYSNIPLNLKQYFAEKHQLPSNIGKPISMLPFNTNSDNLPFKHVKFFNALNVNNLVSSPFRNMSNTAPLISPDKYNFLVNSQHQLKTNLLETIPSKMYGNMKLLNNPSATYLDHLNVKPNSDKYSAENLTQLESYASKSTENNNHIEHPIHIPLNSSNSAYNNPVLFNYLNNYNNRALVNNKIKSQFSTFPKINVSNANFVYGKPELPIGSEYIKHNSSKNVKANIISLNTADNEESIKKNTGNRNTMISINSNRNNTYDSLNQSISKNTFHLDFNEMSYSPSPKFNTSFQPYLDPNNLTQKFTLRSQINHPSQDISQLNKNLETNHELLNNKKTFNTNLRVGSLKPESVAVVDKNLQSNNLNLQYNHEKLVRVLFNQSQLNIDLNNNKTEEFKRQTEEKLNTTVLENNIHKAIYDLTHTREPGSKASYASTKLTSVDDLPAITVEPNSNGDIELIYVFQHPQVVVYQPQVLLKRRISYFDYINNSRNILDKTEENLHLYKIVRYLPNNKLQILYQSDNQFPILRLQN